MVGASVYWARHTCPSVGSIGIELKPEPRNTEFQTICLNVITPFWQISAHLLGSVAAATIAVFCIWSFMRFLVLIVYMLGRTSEAHINYNTINFAPFPC